MHFWPLFLCRLRSNAGLKREGEDSIVPKGAR